MRLDAFTSSLVESLKRDTVAARLGQGGEQLLSRPLLSVRERPAVGSRTRRLGVHQVVLRIVYRGTQVNQFTRAKLNEADEAVASVGIGQSRAHLLTHSSAADLCLKASPVVLRVGRPT